MALSILVAQILAVVYIAVGISAVRGKPNFADMVDDFERSPALTYVTGFFTLVIGMLLLHVHNIWVKNWTVLITIVAWMATIKGFFLIAFPNFISAFKGWYRNTQVWGFFLIALGLLFGYFGFFAG